MFGVSAQEDTDSTRQDEATVYITVEDANDHPPVFVGVLPYEFRIRENVAEGFIVGSVNVTDVDAGQNERVRYYVLSSTIVYYMQTNV